MTALTIILLNYQFYNINNNNMLALLLYNNYYIIDINVIQRCYYLNRQKAKQYDYYIRQLMIIHTLYEVADALNCYTHII